jgi:putative spermidine/putrescine transport system ATP-binding protein
MNEGIAEPRTETMVEVTGLAKNYGDVVALAEVDLQVRRGEFVTLLGPSGSGKTTLLNLIAGMTRPSRGRIRIAGVDVTDSPPSRRQLGMVFQNYALMPHMTVFDNVAFPLRIRRVPAADIRERVHEALALVRLPDMAERKPKELSGGQQQRVSLARCIVYNPSLILLDEPLGALDKKLREQMQIEIRRLQEDLGITMLNVTHDQHEALTMSDRIVLMNHGRIEQEGHPEELYYRPRSLFAADFLGNANLVPVMLEGRHDENVVLRVGGDRIVMSGQGDSLVEGERAHLLIRPENLRLAEEFTSQDGDVQKIDGVVDNEFVLGGTVRLLVRAWNMEFMLELQNRRNRPAIARGAQIRFGWKHSDAVLLRG